MKKRLEDLRPTQFAVGMAEVQHKIDHVSKLKSHERQEYLESHPVPVVLCHRGMAHVIDHHHLVRACWELGIDSVKTEVKADFTHLNEDQFWEEMTKRKWTHLHDQFGSGPHPPQLLPMDVRGMADDPYRSLAWAIREAGGFTKVDVPFFEFRWADFFRKRLTIVRNPEGIESAKKEAMKLAHSAEASHLPGFVGAPKTP